MIKIESYSKKKKNNNQGGGVGNNTVVNSSTTLSPHYILDKYLTERKISKVILKMLKI